MDPEHLDAGHGLDRAGDRTLRRPPAQGVPRSGRARLQRCAGRVWAEAGSG